MAGDAQAQGAATTIGPGLRGDIAIVGMSCLLPGATDAVAFWRNIIARVDAISDPPADAWDPEVYYDPESNRNDRTYCKRGGYIDDIASFRPADFGVMPVNVEGGEPDQWLALKLAHEALADAGYPDSVPQHLRTEVILGKGTYINRGNMTVGYHGLIVDQVLRILKNLDGNYTEADLERVRAELKAGLPPFSADTAPALIGNIIVGRIANRLDLMGPSFTVDAACASALLAVEIGVSDLRSGKCDVVLAGGSNVYTPLPTMILFCQLGALSRTEKIRPFDEHADGTLLGEGLGLLVLKRVADAERDGDAIYAVIKGVGTASDGRGQHVMAPRVEGEITALRRAYESAGVEPASVGLIEAHGTATPVGDVVEIEALSSVFGERASGLPGCAIGSVKSMIGHTMPAAGVAGMIKAALALHHKVLPPTLNCETPNAALRVPQSRFYVNPDVRPWIHGGAEPRRAGVNAFGFGGINGHVVLEEYRGDNGAREPANWLAWETELCVLAAGSRAELIEQGRKLQAFAAAPGDARLADVAASVNAVSAPGGERLAIVAGSFDELGARLERALGRLEDPGCAQIKDNKGIYYFAEPLARSGRLALMFPGEGAQYPHMLADLCGSFPEVRQCFDLADRAFADHPRGYLPSDYIFPRSLALEADREAMQARLWAIDGAVESVLIASRALRALLERLGLKPDAVVGHSTGEYSAMFAAGVIRFEDEASYIQTIHAWNDAHLGLSERIASPPAALVAVGADEAEVTRIVEQTGGDLYVAMRNCPHQSVIVGSPADVDRAVETMRAAGMILERLPFDRPYHTPLFREYSEGARSEFFVNLPITAPRVPLYSCTSAGRYPDDRGAIEDLFVDLWAEPVRFTDTIEQMYADGVRLFVEAGPRGNLTAFVGDILRGQPHLAVASNLPNRSGITQLNHLAGLLSAQGLALDLGHLHAGRGTRRVEWRQGAVAAPAKKPAMSLKLSTPPFEVAPRAASAQSQPSSAPAPSVVAPAPETASSAPPAAPARAAPAPVPPAAAPDVAVPPLATTAAPAGRAGVMARHLDGMRDFLDVQNEVMNAFLRRAGRTAAPAPTVATPAPLLGTVEVHADGQQLSARRVFDRATDIFLEHHALGPPVALTDPGLKPIVVVPLTVSMEMLAEAAAALAPGSVVTGMRDISAQSFIRVDDDPVALAIKAVRSAAQADEIEVEIRAAEETSDGSVGRFPLVRAVVTVAPAYSSAPAATAFALDDPRPSAYAGGNPYELGLMFHGPCFRGVVELAEHGADGARATLEVLPPEGLFRDVSAPAFALDPVTLDAAGQVVGLWARERLERGFVVFPYRLGSLSVHAPAPPPGSRIECRVKVELIGDARTRADIDVLTPDGALWMRLSGWEDRRFDPPPRFHALWQAPTQQDLGEPWPALAALVPQAALICRRVDLAFEPPNPFWDELWSTLVLARTERPIHAALGGPPPRRTDWLRGRTAAKSAVRAWLAARGTALAAADILIEPDPHGRPCAAGQWAGPSPALSLAHSGGIAVAVAGDPDTAARVGVDLERMRPLAPEFVEASFNQAEQSLAAALGDDARTEWLLRLWCVKEAIGKGLGRGLLGGPVSVRIQSLDVASGAVTAVLSAALAAACPEMAAHTLTAYTLRDGDYVAAVTLCQRNQQ